MLSFKLPAANQPAWAKVIPEEEWKANLLKQLQTSQSGEHKLSDLLSSPREKNHSSAKQKETSENKIDKVECSGEVKASTSKCQQEKSGD